MTRLWVVFLLVASSAGAEFTEAEKAEIKKIGRARHEIAMAFKRAGEAIEVRGTDANRTSYYAALQPTFVAHDKCFLAWGHALNSPGIGGYFPDRPARVADLSNDVGNCRNAAVEAIARWEGLGEGAVVARIAAARDLLASFNTSLGYLDWRPSAYPASFGPHGDWFLEQRHLHRTGQYFLGHTLGDVIAFYGDAASIPATCNSALKDTLRRIQEMTSRHVRGWALMAGLVYTEFWGGDLSDDAAYIQAESNASNGIRPPSFFNVPLASQYLWNKSQSVTQAGQALKFGVNPHAFIYSASFAGLVECATQAQTDLAEVKRWWQQGSKTTGTVGGPGRAKEFFVDFGDGWNDHDMPAAGVLNFFREVPIPPGGGGVTCGEGTHEEGGACVPDENCPTFAGEMVLLSPTEALCTVVEQP